MSDPGDWREDEGAERADEGDALEQSHVVTDVDDDGYQRTVDDRG